MVGTLFQQWYCIGDKVQGASHKRNNLPNQDSINILSNTGLSIILAVSDGHGSAKSFRSDKGSRLATEKAIEVLQELLADFSNDSSHLSNSEITNLVENILPRRIVYQWRQAVEEDLDNFPITELEWAKLEEQGGIKTKQQVSENKEIAYGATLLSVFLTESFILYLQLGDGDILCVDAKSNVTCPLKPDERLIANETTSLCLKDAWKDFRVHLELYPQGSTDKMPVLILVSTDGYSNSYSSEEDFHEVAKEYLEKIRDRGIDAVKEELPNLLEEATTKGSGDDIALGIIRRIENVDSDSSSKQADVFKDNQNTQNINEELKHCLNAEAKDTDEIEGEREQHRKLSEQEIKKGSDVETERDWKKKIEQLQKRSHIAIAIALIALVSITLNILVLIRLSQVAANIDTLVQTITSNPLNNHSSQLQREVNQDRTPANKISIDNSKPGSKQQVKPKDSISLPRSKSSNNLNQGANR